MHNIVGLLSRKNNFTYWKASNINGFIIGGHHWLVQWSHFSLDDTLMQDLDYEWGNEVHWWGNTDPSSQNEISRAILSTSTSFLDGLYKVSWQSNVTPSLPVGFRSVSNRFRPFPVCFRCSSDLLFNNWKIKKSKNLFKNLKIRFSGTQCISLHLWTLSVILLAGSNRITHLCVSVWIREEQKTLLNLDP